MVNEQISRGLFENSYTISKGIYCSFKNDLVFKESQIASIKSRMKELIKENIPFEVELKKREEGIEILKNIPGKSGKAIFENKFPDILGVPLKRGRNGGLRGS